MGYVYDDAYVVRQSAWDAWLGVLRNDRGLTRPETLAVWWVCAATEGRISPDKVARRLDGYVKRGADRSRVWAGVARVRRIYALIERDRVEWSRRLR